MCAKIGAPWPYEEKTPSKGYFLLVPWLLIGTIWLGLNTGLDPQALTFYFQLLVAGSLAIVIGDKVWPKMNVARTMWNRKRFLN
jgi:hypothetical protein